MSSSNITTPSQPPKPTSSSMNAAPGSSSTFKAKKLDAVIDHGIVAAKVARDSVGTSPLLGPLKASMDTLISVLEAVRVSWRGYSRRSYPDVKNNRQPSRIKQTGLPSFSAFKIKSTISPGNYKGSKGMMTLQN
jgi:hypothetical protein